MYTNTEGIVKNWIESHKYLERHKGKIYFLLDKKDAKIKIGFSGRLKKRIRELRSSFPNELSLIYILNGDKVDERFLHILFRAFKLKGEWFLFNNDFEKQFYRLFRNGL